MKEGRGWVYVAKHPSTDRVKIGFSLNPKTRIKYLNFAIIAFGLTPVEIVYKIELDNARDVEQLVLKTLEYCRANAGASREVFAISVIDAQHAIEAARLCLAAAAALPFPAPSSPSTTSPSAKLVDLITQGPP